LTNNNRTLVLTTKSVQWNLSQKYFSDVAVAFFT